MEAISRDTDPAAISITDIGLPAHSLGGCRVNTEAERTEFGRLKRKPDIFILRTKTARIGRDCCK